jgi:cytochrome c553
MTTTSTTSRGPFVVLFALLAACGSDNDKEESKGGRDASTPAQEHDASLPPENHDASTGGGGNDAGGGGNDAATPADAGTMVSGACAQDDGQCIFRYDTFGDEQLWTDVLKLHELVSTLPPTTALSVGLKVDSERVPAEVLASADLNDPKTTVALLGLDAVVGVKAEVNDGKIDKIGITCALCHSTVDNSVMPGVGKRLDGWPNRDLNPGAIIALTPGLADFVATLGVDVETAKAALNSWGPGRYDARFNQDKQSHPVLIPPAYGLKDVALETYTGEGPVSYWNAYVAVTQMGAHGNFKDDRLGIDIVQTPDLVTDKLPALRDYQFSLDAPKPAQGAFDADAAARGEQLFAGAAKCATCHAGEAYTDAPTLHTAAEVGMEPVEAERSASKKYRTTPLRGLLTHPPYFHDGSAATLSDVVDHYDGLLELSLTDPQKTDLVEYLKSL